MPVAPPREAEDVRLVNVLEHRVAATHIAVQGGVADRHLRLVAGGKHHVAQFVGKRHEGDGARTRLDILFRHVRLMPGEAFAQHVVEGVHGALDPDGGEIGAESARNRLRVLDALLRGIGRGHHDAVDLLRAQGVGRHRRRQRRIDTAGQPDQHAGKGVLVHVIAQPDHHGEIDRLQPFRHLRARICFATPGAIGAPVRRRRPAGRQEVLLKARRPGTQVPVRRDDEGCAIEHQLVLPADLIDVDERQFDLANPPGRQGKALAPLVGFKG